MLNYTPNEPTNLFVKMEREAIEELTANAFFLYAHLRRLSPNEDNSRLSLRKKTCLSEDKFRKAKNELLDRGFLDTKQVYGNKYVFYVSKEIVQRYKASRSKKYNRHELSQLKQVTKDLL